MCKSFENSGAYFEPTIKAKAILDYDGTVDSINDISVDTGRSRADIERMLSAEGLLL